MKRIKYAKKVVAVFLTLNFMTTIVPFNLLMANTNGPNSPEASGFEPVDATDMVNLTNGDLTYILPLLDVEGFPVNLSYHAGIPVDMDASWVGLGWYLNPGAINRSVTGIPDDFNGSVGINFNTFQNEEEYYGVTAEVGFPGTVSVGAGLNWGGGKGVSGSVSVAFGLDAATGGMIKGGASASISSIGNISIGVGAGIGKSVGVGASVSYSLQDQKIIGVGIGVGVSTGEGGPQGFENTSFGLGVSMSRNGGISVGAGGSTNGSAAGVGASSFSQGDASVETQSFAVAVPLHVVGIPLTLGFNKSKVKINIKKGFYDNEWGSLYSATNTSTNGQSAINNVSNFDPYYTDYSTRSNSMDMYSTRIPQTEEEFIGDYSNKIENINFTTIGYDSYNVAAQGLMGNVKPRVFKNSNIFGKGERSKNSLGRDIHTFWHYGKTNDNSRPDRSLGLGSNGYDNKDFYFYFDGQFTKNEMNDVNFNGISSNYLNSRNLSDIVNQGGHSGPSTSNVNYGRSHSPSFVEVFTNAEISNSNSSTVNFISPKNLTRTDRGNTSNFDPNGIGAYKITSPDGKTYHFSVPVYHFEQVTRGLINQQEDDQFNVGNVNEKRQYSRYATHWLLSAITGPDYIDTNNNGFVDNDDYGYWVELEYGKWSDGYVWRSPYQDRVYNYNTDIKGEIGRGDKGSYSFGRKQLYYLDRINTRNRTALFVKDIRQDAIGKELSFKLRNGDSDLIGCTGNGCNTNSLNKTESNVFIRETGVHYQTEYTLGLDKIILLDSKVGSTLSKWNTNSLGGAFQGYAPDSQNSPGWISPDFSYVYENNYSYGMHLEDNVIDVNDINTSIINQAIKIIDLEYDYSLAKNSPSSFGAANNPFYGKLTLKSVQTLGRQGVKTMPKSEFNYYGTNLENFAAESFGQNNPTNEQIATYIEQKKEAVDSWGFRQGTYLGSSGIQSKAVAWSLKKIKTPTGAAIDIKYQEDDYWTEAFSRRYWMDGLEAKFTSENGKRYIYFRQDQDAISNETINFRHYFDLDERVYLDTQYLRNPTCGGCEHRIADFSGMFNINSISSNEIKIELPSSDQNSMLRTDCSQFGWSFTQFYNSGSSTVSVVERFVNYLGPLGDSNFCGNVGTNGDSKFKYRLLANRVPEDETGGGLRVSEITTSDGLSGNYKVNYDYSHPFKNRTSGITSYAPVDGVKYVPYQSEVPSPGVMYEYVTMKESSGSNTNDFNSKTRFRHYVLKPVTNIFNPNIEMEAMDSDAPLEDNIFWAEVEDNYKGLDGNNTRNLKAKKIEINLNTALLGQVKSVEKLNAFDQVMVKTVNEFANGRRLNSSNKGIVKETFNSMKSVFETNAEGTSIVSENTKRLLSISSKTEYNNILKKTITTTGSHTNYIDYLNVDPWLGSFTQTRSTLADGTVVFDEKIPAYSKYPAMGSKVLDPNNKNMLSQETLSLRYLSGSTNTLSASLTSWSNEWDYSYLENSETFPLPFKSSTAINDGVWRKKSNYVWRDAIDNVDGTYSTQLSSFRNYFDFNNNQPTSDKWLKISEVIKYNPFSIPVESMDINGNFVASFMGDQQNKVLASGNAMLSELKYSGAEFRFTGSEFEGGIRGVNFISQDIAHTGYYSLKSSTPNSRLFEVSGAVSSGHSDISKAFRPGKYKVSLWAYRTGSAEAGARLVFNGQQIIASETMNAGCWKLHNFYVDLNPNTSFNLYATSISEGVYYMDDFRMHPVYASMTSYVYDFLDQLTFILDSQNLGMAFTYDHAGRLSNTFTEIEDFGVINSVNGGTRGNGGFLLSQQYKQNYSGVDYEANYNTEINGCLGGTATF